MTNGKTRVRKVPDAKAEKTEKESVSKRGFIRRGFSKLHLSDNPISRFLGKILRPFGRLLYRLVPKYFINSWREVRKVTWPTRQETIRLTGAVFVFAIVFGALVAGVDRILDEFFKKVIIK